MMVWRRRQQVREAVTGKLVPVEFELKAVRSETEKARCSLISQAFRTLQ